MLECVALIVAAGRGTRASNDAALPKQYRALAGETIVRRTVRAFADHPAVDAVRVVMSEDDRLLYEKSLSGLDLLAPVRGGATRRESVLRGLESLADMEDNVPKYVLIHDAARPLVDPTLIGRVRKGLDHHIGVVPALAIADTIKHAKAGHILNTMSRDGLWRAQTPQGFRFADILAAHRTAAGLMDADHFTDDAMIAEAAGLGVVTVAGDEDNMKITTEADFARAERILLGSLPDIRTGQGFDVHAFGEAQSGSTIMMCGVKIPHPRPLIGHSDADVGLHALTDAVLGAIGDGDIGSHFPPSDPRWRGADSEIFLKHAASLVTSRGGRIVHADITVLCEEPRVSPHRDAMRQRVAAILALPLDRVSVKATTTEKLGFLGRSEGIAAQAIATVRLPAVG
jgi:2-C-methyl-D-erythritol 4-phosphate cytidylyltransferase/2-C-methyl-D-erythritol 2,4-cyclodiphosphate synthase